MSIRKLYVIPTEFYDSLMRRTKITENPLLASQVSIEKEKEKTLRKRGVNTDKKLAEYVNLSQKQGILEEQRKSKPTNLAETKPPEIAATAVKTPDKKPGRPPKKPLAKYFEYQLGTGGKKKKRDSLPKCNRDFLHNFYEYEPKGKTAETIRNHIKCL